MLKLYTLNTWKQQPECDTSKFSIITFLARWIMSKFSAQSTDLGAVTISPAWKTSSPANKVAGIQRSRFAIIAFVFL